MSGKSNRKHRRNKEYCEHYKKSGQESINKLLKAERHSAEHPNDKPAKGKVDYTRKKPLSNWEAFVQRLHNFHK